MYLRRRPILENFNPQKFGYIWYVRQCEKIVSQYYIGLDYCSFISRVSTFHPETDGCSHGDMTTVTKIPRSIVSIRMQPGRVSMCMGMCVCVFVSMCVCTVYIDSMCVCLYCMCLCMCVTIIFYSRSVQYVSCLVYDSAGQVSLISTCMIVIIIILYRPYEMYYRGIMSRREYHTYFWGDRMTG